MTTKEYQRQYRDKHRAKAAQYAREYREKRKGSGQFEKYYTAYYLKNKEKRGAYAKEWSKKNPEKCREYERIKRAKKFGCKIGDTRAIVVWERRVLSAIFVKCYWCLSTISSKEAEIDHIVSLSVGGPHELENLCVSCLPCNRKKKSKVVSKWSSEIENPILV